MYVFILLSSVPDTGFFITLNRLKPDIYSGLTQTNIIPHHQRGIFFAIFLASNKYFYKEAYAAD